MACLSTAAASFRSVVPRAVAARRSSTPANSLRAMASSSSSSNAPVQSVLGTMTMGWKFASAECGDDVSRELIKTFLDAGRGGGGGGGVWGGGGA
jgi:hypothetical protein